jgi:hypothetical protein
VYGPVLGLLLMAPTGACALNCSASAWVSAATQPALVHCSMHLPALPGWSRLAQGLRALACMKVNDGLP